MATTDRVKTLPTCSLFAYQYGMLTLELSFKSLLQIPNDAPTTLCQI